MSNEKKWTGADYPGMSLNYTSIEEVIKQLQTALADQERGEWRGLCLEISEGYDNSHSIVVSGSRLETDNERDRRLKEEAQRDAALRRQYDELKKKFGDK